jgi:hypothetical protein
MKMKIPAMFTVPSTWFESGTNFIGRPESRCEDRYAEWIQDACHTPTGEIPDAVAFDGLVEDARVSFRLSLTIADDDTMPISYPRDFFGRARAGTGWACRVESC